MPKFALKYANLTFIKYFVLDTIKRWDIGPSVKWYTVSYVRFSCFAATVYETKLRERFRWHLTISIFTMHRKSVVIKLFYILKTSYWFYTICTNLDPHCRNRINLIIRMTLLDLQDLMHFMLCNSKKKEKEERNMLLYIPYIFNADLTFHHQSCILILKYSECIMFNSKLIHLNILLFFCCILYQWLNFAYLAFWLKILIIADSLYLYVC